MIEKQVTIYRCGFCNKLYLKKAYCERHEGICGKNQINWRDCFECPHLTNKTGEAPTNLYYGPEMQTVKFLFCEKRKVALYPPKIERSRRGAYECLWDNGEEYINEPMPKVGECEIYKQIKERQTSDNWLDCVLEKEY